MARIYLKTKYGLEKQDIDDELIEELINNNKDINKKKMLGALVKLLVKRGIKWIG